MCVCVCVYLNFLLILLIIYKLFLYFCKHALLQVDTPEFENEYLQVLFLILT